MAHADGVGVGKCQASFLLDLAMVLADHVQLAPQVLGRSLHLGRADGGPRTALVVR